MALYHDSSTLSSAGAPVDGVTVYALAGDGLGDAAWLQTTSSPLATAWIEQSGTSAGLNHATFLDFRSKYLLGAGGTV